MITLRRSSARGRADHGWLDSRHTFSFGEFHDPEHMGFRSLRVINEDRVAAAAGFPTHRHQNMEIISYVLGGALAHKDSMGNGSTMTPGDVQRMTAGTGVAHSEFNASATEPVHFLQIWILPEAQGIAPGYEQKHFSADDKRGKLRLVVAPDGRDGAVRVHQDLRVYAAILAAGQRVEHTLAKGRHAWLQVARGKVKLGDEQLGRGDGAAVSDEPVLAIEGVASVDGDAEILLFDLA